MKAYLLKNGCACEHPEFFTLLPYRENTVCCCLNFFFFWCVLSTKKKMFSAETFQVTFIVIVSFFIIWHTNQHYVDRKN